MGDFLGELGKKLAERWLTLLVLPGVLYLAVAATAHTLGHGHALDLQRLTGRITAWAASPSATTLGGQIVLLTAILAGAAALGLAAQALGALTERLILAADWRTWPPGPRHLAAWRVARRQSRWRQAHDTYHRLLNEATTALATTGQRPDPTPRHRAYHDRLRVALEYPDRPTWSGDRLQALAVRLDRDLHLDVATIWPHLWLILPDQVRAEITAARTALTRATTLAGWTLLYALLTVWWWPAAPLALILASIARHRVRTATTAYAQLAEAATRLHAPNLAHHLGLIATPDTALTPRTGDALTSLLHTQPPPPDPAPADPAPPARRTAPPESASAEPD
ncbi:hypothetical protein AB0K60_16040 [Thermopolyspora sp. NPDC052614]|uniref:hypothetical protein n=1 Tax=Thermopolyspora sp. NPDC052614 TaxID=3155682 RepID=UPI003420F09E